MQVLCLNESFRGQVLDPACCDFVRADVTGLEEVVIVVVAMELLALDSVLEVLRLELPL